SPSSAAANNKEWIEDEALVNSCEWANWA
ncbi:MAG: hypothetical protein HW416_1127, partial [Chloroflexi bacterium]|nr:hypothetical protein [Chloroflexota bacterium]